MSFEVFQPLGMKPMTDEEREAMNNPKGFLFLKTRDYSRQRLQLLVRDGKAFFVTCNTRNKGGVYDNKHGLLTKGAIVEATGDMYIKRWVKRERVFLNKDGSVDTRTDVSRCSYCYSEYCHAGDLCFNHESINHWYYEYRDVQHEEINEAVEFITLEEWGGVEG